MVMETTRYRGQAVDLLVVRSRGGGEVLALVCENGEERAVYERVFRQDPPPVLDHRTPLGRRLRKGHAAPVVELLEPPADGGWPWIVAFYSPLPVRGAQREHWTFEIAGDAAEAEAIALDFHQRVETLSGQSWRVDVRARG